MEGKGYLQAKYLQRGDKLVTVNGEQKIVEFVEHVIYQKPIAVYNFEVEGNHNYFVGHESRVLAHNVCSNKKVYKAKGRTDGFHSAKNEMKIPKSTQPTKVIPNKGHNNKTIPGRIYQFGEDKTKGTYRIIDDPKGHIFKDQTNIGRHFNIEVWDDITKVFKRLNIHIFY